MSVTAIFLTTLLFQLVQQLASSNQFNKFSMETGICESGETCQGCQFCRSGEICPNACVPGAACTFCPPSTQPTSQPPTTEPTYFPSQSPTNSIQPSIWPTTDPTLHPSDIPTSVPSTSFPSSEPTAIPTVPPLFSPTTAPSISPSSIPTVLSTDIPSKRPSRHPSCHPSVKPSRKPSKHPSLQPTQRTSIEPSSIPSLITFSPSIILTQNPITCTPSVIPSTYSINPSGIPTLSPSVSPSSIPTLSPSVSPSNNPTSSSPSISPSGNPTSTPSGSPSSYPLSSPPVSPSCVPTSPPTVRPSIYPTIPPSIPPSSNPTSTPSVAPSSNPTSTPSVAPSSNPTSTPSVAPSSNPTSSPSVSPRSIPTSRPSIPPSSNPTSSPSVSQSSNPMSCPSSEPTLMQQSIPFVVKFTCKPSMTPTLLHSLPFGPRSPPSTTLPISPTLLQGTSQPLNMATAYPSQSPSLTTTHPPALPSPTPYPTVVISLPTSSPAAAASTQTSSTVISMSIIITLAAAFGGICMVIGAIILYKRFRIDVEKENKVRENDNHSNLSYKHASRSGKSNELNPYYFYDSQSMCDERISDRDVQQGLRQSIHTTQDTQDDLEWNSSFRIRSSPYMSPRSPHLLDPNRPLSSGLNFNTNIRHRPRTSIDRDRSLDREETNKHNMMSELSSKSFKLSSTLCATNRDLDTENYLESEEKGILRSQSCRSLFTGVSGLTTGSSKSPRQNFTTTASRIITSAWNSPVITKSSDLEMGRSLSAKSRIGSCSAKLTRLRDQRQRIEATFALNTDDNICVADELRLYKKA